jgi:hypothetical protein
MKAKLKKLTYKQLPWLVTGILSFIVSLGVLGQETKTWEATASYKSNPQVTIHLYDTHAEILPVKEDKIVVQIEYVAEGDNSDALAKLEQAMKTELLKQDGNSITINTNFYSNLKSWSLFGFGEQNYVVLKDGNKLKFDDFTFEIKKLRIYLPSEMELNIDGKYGKIDVLFSVHGDLNFEAYDLDFVGKSIAGKLKVDAKYSKIRFDKVGEARLVLYETRFGATEMGNADIDSKYSQIETATCGGLNYLGYEDKMAITKLPAAKMEAKYCNIRLGDVPNIKANMYEGSLNLKKTNTLDLNAKYLEVDAINLKSLKMMEGYENKILIESVDSLISINGKYNNVEIQNLSSYVKMDGYEEEVKISSVNEAFTSLLFDGKYLELNLTISKNAAYRFKGVVNYPEFRFLREEYKIIYHDKDSDFLKYDYLYGKIDNPIKLIQINGYEVNLTLNNL